MAPKKEARPKGPGTPYSLRCNIVRNCRKTMGCRPFFDGRCEVCRGFQYRLLTKTRFLRSNHPDRRVPVVSLDRWAITACTGCAMKLGLQGMEGKLADQIDEAQLREAMREQGFDFDQAQLAFRHSSFQVESNEPQPQLPSGIEVLTMASSISGDLGKLIWGLPYLEMAKFVICALDRMLNEHRVPMNAVQKCAWLRWPDRPLTQTSPRPHPETG